MPRVPRSQPERWSSLMMRGPTHLAMHLQAEEQQEMTQSREAELLAAAGCGDLARLEKLLPVAGDLTSFDGPNGVTPLMVAACAGHEAVIELLLERGSNPCRRDAEGRSAAAYARMAGHTHLAVRLDGIVDQDQKIW